MLYTEHIVLPRLKVFHVPPRNYNKCLTVPCVEMTETKERLLVEQV